MSGSIVHSLVVDRTTAVCGFPWCAPGRQPTVQKDTHGVAGLEEVLEKFDKICKVRSYYYPCGGIHPVWIAPCVHFLWIRLGVVWCRSPMAVWHVMTFFLFSLGQLQSLVKILALKLNTKIQVVTPTHPPTTNHKLFDIKGRYWGSEIRYVSLPH